MDKNYLQTQSPAGRDRSLTGFHPGHDPPAGIIRPRYYKYYNIL